MMQHDSSFHSQQQGHKIKIDFCCNIKLCYAESLYDLLPKIKEKFEEIANNKFRIEYQDGKDRIQVTTTDELNDAMAEPSKVLVKFFVVLDP